MMHPVRFHVTKHFYQRVDERDLSTENAKNVVQYPDSSRKLNRGRNGGILTMFKKAIDGKTLVVVAEMKKNECWLMTTYYEW